MQVVTPPASPDQFKFVLDELTRGLMDVADEPLLAAGEALWMGLSLIILVWTGARIALSGEGWNPWEVIKLIIILSIPRGMLQFYATPFPGLGMTFPEIIVEQGSWLNGLIVGDTGSTVWTWLQNYIGDTWKTFSEQEVGLGMILAPSDAGGKVIVLAVLAFSSLLTLIVVLLGYSYILFAQIAISILTLFGPLFIPWMIFGPMSFLFWSWFRMMITYSLYAAVAAAIFRVMMGLIMTVGTTYQENVNPDAILAAINDPLSTGVSGIGQALVWFISYVLALLTALLTTLKIPEIAAGLVSGAAGGGGVGGMAMTAAAAAKGGGAVAKVAGKTAGG